ncbi:MAG: hypothetical protein ABII00_01540 [Elusimicrobiota bacterium]
MVNSIYRNATGSPRPKLNKFLRICPVQIGTPNRGTHKGTIEDPINLPVLVIYRHILDAAVVKYTAGRNHQVFDVGSVKISSSYRDWGESCRPVKLLSRHIQGEAHRVDGGKHILSIRAIKITALNLAYINAEVQLPSRVVYGDSADLGNPGTSLNSDFS